MPLSVMKQNFTSRSGVVTIKGETQESVVGAEARKLVEQTAVHVLGGGAGIGGNPSPYPLNANDESPEGLIFGQGGPVVAYAADYAVNGRN